MDHNYLGNSGVVLALTSMVSVEAFVLSRTYKSKGLKESAEHYLGHHPLFSIRRSFLNKILIENRYLRLY